MIEAVNIDAWAADAGARRAGPAVADLNVVNRAGYASPVRTPRGRDILAACGQLRSESLRLSASERRSGAEKA